MKSKVIKRLGACILLLCLAFSVMSCGKGDKKKEKLRDIDFTIVPENDIPEELYKIIETSKDEVMRKTFSDKENLYIVVGYGKQDTSGYSIAVKELYETKNVINVKTWLIGPSKTDKVADIDTYPYIVIKIEYSHKPVVFK